MTWCGTLRDCIAAKFNSCNSLLSYFHTLLVNILRHVRLHIQQKYYYYQCSIQCRQKLLINMVHLRILMLPFQTGFSGWEWTAKEVNAIKAEIVSLACNLDMKHSFWYLLSWGIMTFGNALCFYMLKYFNVLVKRQIRQCFGMLFCPSC